MNSVSSLYKKMKREAQRKDLWLKRVDLLISSETRFV
jgi:hypothetical protein